jgi:hypothetical protein
MSISIGRTGARFVGVSVGIVLGLLMLLAAIATTPASAASTVTVSGTCTLPQAVAFADGTANSCGSPSPPTTINLPASATKYSVSSTLSITKDTTINGGGAPTTVIDGGGAVQVFNIAASTNVVLGGVTITGGTTGNTGGCDTSFPFSCPPRSGLNGGGIFNAGTLALENSIVTGNTTSPGLAATRGLLLCFIFNCPPETGESAGSGGSGAGIDNAGMLTITNSTISNNIAGDGGSGTDGFSGSGIGVGAGQDGGSGSFGGFGGGIFNEGGATATITNSTITGNVAGKGGSAGAGSDSLISPGSGGNAGLSGVGGSGGGIENFGTLTLVGSTVSGNKTGVGGNGATGGAGFGGSNGFSSFSSSGGHGGGVFSEGSPTLTASNDTIANNTASAGGTGGAGAGTGGVGGGVSNDGIGLVALTYVTVGGNQAAGDGGGLFRNSFGPMTETNSIVASNSGSPANNCGGAPPTDDGHNLVFGDTSCPGLVGNPKLGSLPTGPSPNNGGPTPTMALNAGSAAIDLVPFSSCLFPTDQRGVSRPQGPACDAGAYEFAPPSLGGVSATGITTTTAAVSASVNPNLKDAKVVVFYGTTPAYGSATASVDVGFGNSPAPFTAGIGGLAPNTTYHFEVVASNGDGTTTSGDRTFTTLPPVSASIASASTSGPILSLTLACGGGFGPGTCAGPITLTSHVTTQGGSTVAVTSAAKHKRAHRKPKRVTKLVTVATGSYSVATGSRVTVNIKLNRAGQALLTQRYTLPATLSVGGTTSLSRKVTFAYPVITSPISFTWTFTASASVAQQLTITRIPSGGKVAVICRGGGCSFARRTFSPRHGTLAVAPKLGHGGLRPHATLELEITATNRVGKVATFTIRSGQQPTLTEQCLPPGASHPSRCV